MPPSISHVTGLSVPAVHSERPAVMVSVSGSGACAAATLQPTSRAASSARSGVTTTATRLRSGISSPMTTAGARVFPRAAGTRSGPHSSEQKSGCATASGAAMAAASASSSYERRRAAGSYVIVSTTNSSTS